jgi:hypothetical protein
MKTVASRGKDGLAAHDAAVQHRVIAHDLEEADLKETNQAAGLATVVQESQEILNGGEKGLHFFCAPGRRHPPVPPDGGHDGLLEIGTDSAEILYHIAQFEKGEPFWAVLWK